ncbi:hypothetical protein ISN44_As03g039430 [Arabidopsis suecica]|uniref:Uncharacterized protein n=1 Tax=Arabidopsis suecica TaxID=45249 RepID=A0A8T2FBJ5_ARASU|nr:hypothetical protein ISN44_As03g039430 [Arabidopsis suecica]
MLLVAKPELPPFVTCANAPKLQHFNRTSNRHINLERSICSTSCCLSRVKKMKHYMPIVRETPTMELVKLTAEMKSFEAYNTLRVARTMKRHAGARAKRASEAENEEKK